MDIKKLRTTIHRPFTNGAEERFHRTLNSMIGKIIHENQRNWHEVLLQKSWAVYRASEHSPLDSRPTKSCMAENVEHP